MSASIQRKSRIRFNVLGDANINPAATDRGKRCSNCKQVHYLIDNKDNKNLFCTHCGALTPIRSIKHLRGLAVPTIQQPNSTGILQPKNAAADRRPAGIKRPTNPLELEIINQGFQIIDSQYIEPVSE
jgi:hypothetical protein